MPDAIPVSGWNVDLPQGRFAGSIQIGSDPVGCRIALLGLPDDLGVRLNHGRPGAANGPTAFRAALAKYGTRWDASNSRSLAEVGIWDAGDVRPAEGSDEAALHETHRRITDALLSIHRAKLLPVCIGGGHDLTFPALRALAHHAGACIGGVNIDPHLDVRETIGSGMPFRALIDGGHLDASRFTVLGAGRFTNSVEHARWLNDRGGTIIGIEELQRDVPGRLKHALDRASGVDRVDSRDAHPVFVSFDLDALDAAHAPGVSALNPCGLTPGEGAIIAETAGSDPRVRHFDLMELCPEHDEQGRTARIAALLFLHFVAGFAARPTLSGGDP